MVFSTLNTRKNPSHCHTCKLCFKYTTVNTGTYLLLLLRESLLPQLRRDRPSRFEQKIERGQAPERERRGGAFEWTLVPRHRFNPHVAKKRVKKGRERSGFRKGVQAHGHRRETAALFLSLPSLLLSGLSALHLMILKL